MTLHNHTLLPVTRRLAIGVLFVCSVGGCVLADAADTTGTAAAAESEQAWDEAVDGVRSQLAEHVDSDRVGGLAVGFVAQGELVWAEGFGVADRDSEARVTPETAFGVGPVTKVFTSLLLVRLADRGVVDLHQPVVTLVPEFEQVRELVPGVADVTLHQLANHTSGLARDFNVALADDRWDWRDVVLSSLLDLELDALPGSRYQDLPAGYGVLGLALERAAGRDFETLLGEEVFEPLGMVSSFVGPPRDPTERVARAYPNRTNGTILRSARGVSGGGGYVAPASGVYSTVRDLARLVAALTQSDAGFLSTSSLGYVTSPQTPGGLHPERGDGYPLFGTRPVAFDDGSGGRVPSPEVLDPPHSFGLWLSSEDEDVTLLYAGGVVDGFTAAIAIDPRSRSGAIMLRNYWKGATDVRDGAIGILEVLDSKVIGP